MIFSKLPRNAQKAAFAHMSAAGKAKTAAAPKTKKKASPAKGSASKKMNAGAGKPRQETAQVINPKPGGGFEVAGRISREDAAAIMFGTRGAAARIAKANAKRRRK